MFQAEPQLPEWAIKLGATPAGFASYKRRAAVRPAGVGMSPTSVSRPVTPPAAGSEVGADTNQGRHLGQGPDAPGQRVGLRRRMSNEEIQSGLDGGKMRVADAVRHLDGRKGPRSGRPTLSSGSDAPIGPPATGAVPTVGEAPAPIGPPAVGGAPILLGEAPAPIGPPATGATPVPVPNPMLGSREALAAILRAQLLGGGMPTMPAYGGTA